jgi:choice-of-anchor B domain-containing protein
MTRLTLPGAALAIGALLTGCAQTAAVSDDVDVAAAAPVAEPVAEAPPMLAACEDGAATVAGSELGAFECQDVDLLAHVPLDVLDPEADRANDIWGWTDPETGKEYALVGLSNGTAFVDISVPTAPVHLGTLPTATVATVWRDIKTYADHAFIVSEARDHGMQVFDLARLRGLGEDPTRRFDADARYTGVTNVHNLVINEETGYAYNVGSGSRGDDLPAACGAPGFHAVNIQDPLNPTFAGCFSDADKDTGPVAAPGYTHDAQCIVYDGPDEDYTGREICVASNEDVVSIFDVTDKDDVRLVSMAAYPADAYTHQNWFTEDRTVVLANDELDETNGNVDTQRTLIFDVRDLDEPEFIGAYDSGLTTIDHNLYVKGNLNYQSNYESGLRILDHSNALDGELREVAFFDTYPQDTSISFNGQWSNYPYFESGVVVANDGNNGLFVLMPRISGPSRVGGGGN